MDEVKTGYIEHYGRVMSDEDVEKMFKAVDSDNSGFIDYSEFVVAAMNEKQLTTKLEKDLKGELAQHKREVKNDFKEIQEKGFGDLLASVGKAVRDEMRRDNGGKPQKRSFGNSSGRRNGFDP